MCGRYVFNKPGAILDEALENLDGYQLVSCQPNLQPRFNVAPTQEMPILYRSDPDSVDAAQPHDKSVAISLARWSFSNTPSRRGGNTRPLINARLETVSDKRSFAASFQSRRCLVPASGFYEWRATGNRQPFFFQARESAKSSGFCFAGLWQEAARSPQETAKEYCIITGSAGSNMADVHHRRPVILAGNHYATWLDHQSTDDQLLELLKQDDPALTSHPVSFRVNKVHCDEPSLLEPVREAPTNLSLF